MLHDGSPPPIRQKPSTLAEKAPDQLINLVQDLLRSCTSVVFAYLYGSFLYIETGGRISPPPRDIDLAIYVQGADPIVVEMELQQKFFHITGLPPETMDVRSLNSAPDSFIMNVLTKGRLLLCRDQIMHADYIEAVSNRYRQVRELIETTYA